MITAKTCKIEEREIVEDNLESMTDEEISLFLAKEDTHLKYVIRVESFELNCGGCPTSYTFKDYDDNYYTFRLRHGGWSFREDSKSSLVSDVTSKYDGVCDYDEMLDLLYEKGVLLID